MIFFFCKNKLKINLMTFEERNYLIIYRENISKLNSDKRKFYVIRKDERDLESIDYSTCSFPTYLNIINKTWIKPLITIQLIHGM